MKVKKYILAGLIALIGLTTYTNAINYATGNYNDGDYGSKRMRGEIGDLYTSPFDSNYKIGIYPKAILSTTYGLNNKSILYTDENFIFFRDENNSPYIYAHTVLNNNGMTTQGIPTSIYLCSGLQLNQVPQNCTKYNENIDSYYNQRFNQINSNDIYFIGREYKRNCQGYSQNHQYTYTICFSNSYQNNSVCLAVGFETHGVVYGCQAGLLFYENTVLQGSLGLNNPTFADITQYGNSPGYTQTQVNDYSCPTAQQLLNTYGTEYNQQLCYSSNIIYSGGTIQTVTPKSIFELYPTRQELNQDIQVYNSYCKSPNTTQACQTMFEGKEEEYTLIAKIPQNVQPIKLYQYCNLKLNYEPNQTTCTVNTGAIPGVSTGGITVDDVITAIGNGEYTVITPGKPPKGQQGSGSVYDSLIGNEEQPNRRDIIGNAKNIINTIQELYTKFTGIFRARSGTNGIIPRPITSLILLIVLYKLFKR